MTGIQGGALEASKHRRLLAILGVVSVLFLGLWATKGPLAQVHAAPSLGNNAFCTDVWLQPHGRNGDSCSAGQGNWGRIHSVTIRTYTRAGCVNYHGWYGEFYRSWNCYGNETYGRVYVPNDGGSYIGVIRNNNLSYSGKFGGAFACCY